MSRTAYTVVGVMPRGFEFPAGCEIWLTAGVFRRLPEPVGIRMSLGARPMDVIRQIVLHGLKLTLIGVVIGLACASGLTRILQSQLNETPALNPALFVGIAALFVIVTAAACFLPACKALKADPMTALRCE